MSFTKFDLNSDLEELYKMVEWLPDYLKQSQLYFSIGGGFFTGGKYPKLTIGALLMRLRRLNALSTTMDDKQRTQLGAYQLQHDKIRADKTDKYTAKMEREINSRLDAMQRFFEECRESPKQCKGIYAPEVLRRTISEEIWIVMSDTGIKSSEITTKRNQMDKRLRPLVEPSPFVWDEQLEAIYPQNTFWWMYMSPHS